jgi:hypothetical protein
MFRLSDKKTGGGIFLKAHKTYFSDYKIQNNMRCGIKKLNKTTRMLQANPDTLQTNPPNVAGKYGYVAGNPFL